MLSTGFVVTGGVIVTAMAGYAGRLLYLLKQQNDRRLAMILARRRRIIDSLHILAGALSREELVPSEGAIRCCELLQALPQRDGMVTDHQSAYPGLFALYREVKKLPRGEARKKYSKQQIMRMDWERMQVEAEHAQQILEDAVRLQQLEV